MNTKKDSGFSQFIITALLLFLFWLLVSGLFTPKHLTIGAITSLAVAWITRRSLQLPSMETPGKTHSPFKIAYFKFFLYLIWLFKENVKSNIYVIKLVLHPKMPIDPVIVKFEKKMDNPLAHVILGSSIALTPGTVTIEIEDSVYAVHAITKEAGASLKPIGGRDADMVRMVGGLFEE